MSKQDGGQAFPRVVEQPNGYMQAVDGMSLRDYFMAHAPDAPQWWRGGECKRMDDVVSWRVSYADAMLKAREQP